MNTINSTQRCAAQGDLCLVYTRLHTYKCLPGWNVLSCCSSLRLTPLKCQSKHKCVFNIYNVQILKLACAQYINVYKIELCIYIVYNTSREAGPRQPFLLWCFHDSTSINGVSYDSVSNDNALLVMLTMLTVYDSRPARCPWRRSAVVNACLCRYRKIRNTRFNWLTC